MVPELTLLERFRADLDALITPEARLGIAVSGGPDSMALLLLAAAVRPGQIEAATVDHSLRDGGLAEAQMVAATCERYGVAHSILTAHWGAKPASAIQERARRERYRLLGFWTEERRLDALVTGHHADDQAETLLMRLNRGSGVRGLAGMRRKSIAAGTEVRLIRPLLGWRRTELERVCADAGVVPASDPSNDDEAYERVRFRRGLLQAHWLDPAAIARSAVNLAEAEIGLDWAMRREWERSVRERRDGIIYRPDGAPREIVRRVVVRAIRRLATEGDTELRGGELDRLLQTLDERGSATLRGVLASGGPEWRFSQAPARRK